MVLDDYLEDELFTDYDEAIKEALSKPYSENVYDYFESTDVMAEFIYSCNDKMGAAYDITSLSDTEKHIYRLCLDHICDSGNGRLYVSDITTFYHIKALFVLRGDFYSQNYEKAKSYLIKSCDDVSPAGYVRSVNYVAYLTKLDELGNDRRELLPYVAESHLYGSEIGTCLWANLKFNGFYRMPIIDTDIPISILSDVKTRARTKFLAQEFVNALPYACFYLSRVFMFIYDRCRSWDDYVAAYKNLVEAKYSLVARISHNKDNITLFFDHYLMNEIDRDIEVMEKHLGYKFERKLEYDLSTRLLFYKELSYIEIDLHEDLGEAAEESFESFLEEFTEHIEETVKSDD